MFNLDDGYFIILLAVLILSACAFVWSRHRKNQLQSMVANFSTSAFVKAGIQNFEIRFEHDGTVFKCLNSTSKSTFFELNFYLPQFNEKFLIRQNSTLAGFHAGIDVGQFSSAVSIPNLSNDYLVFSPNLDFTKTLLSNKAVLEKIYLLNSEFTYPLIWFEGGQFKLELFSGSGWNLVEKFNIICYAAIVFHDNIKGNVLR
jgi:hypothetical protein